MQRGLGVRHGLDEGDVGPQDVFEDVLGVAGGADPEDLERGAGVLDLRLERAEDVLGVLDRIALGQLVRLHQDVAVLVEERRLRGRRSAVEADEPAHDLAGLERRRDERRDRVALDEAVELVARVPEPAAAGGLLLLEATDVDVVAQELGAAVGPDALLFLLAELDGAEGGEVLGVVGHPDQIAGVVALRQRRLALLPDLGDVLLPGLDHARGCRCSDRRAAARAAAGCCRGSARTGSGR